MNDQIAILRALIRALYPYATGTAEQFDSLDDLELGTEQRPFSGYDLYENACVKHYELTQGHPMPEDPGMVDEYAKTLLLTHNELPGD